MEAHKCCKLNSLQLEAQQNQLKREEILAKLEAIKKKPTGLSFPNLINEIEKELSVSLTFRNEVLSINQFRNCWYTETELSGTGISIFRVLEH